MLNYISLVLFLLIAILAYYLTPPKHLNHIPTVPFVPFIYSIISREASDKRIERLIAPILYKHGIAKFWLNRWIVVIHDVEKSRDILNKTTSYEKQGLILNSKHSLGAKFLGRNIVFTSGEEWRRHRKVANPAFHRSWSTVQIGECGQALLNKIGLKEGPIEVMELFRGMTLDALGKAVFNFNFNAIENPEGEYVTLYNDIFNDLRNVFFFFFPILENAYFTLRPKSHKKVKKFRELIKNVLYEKKKLLESKKDVKVEDMDLLTLMVKATMESDDGEPLLTEEEMIDDAVVFFLAGHDTTANTLGFIFYYLSVNPEVQEKARKEIRQVMEGNSGIPSQEQLKSMVYISAIIHEAMRMKPTVFQLFRVSKEAVEVYPGTILPPNQSVSINLYSMLHDEKHWKNPERFQPERFLKHILNEEGKEVVEFDKSVTKAWLPFGGGPRSCIGMGFSLMEQKIAIAMLLNKFSVSLPEGSPHSNGVICTPTGLTHPSNLELTFTKL